MSAVTSFSQGMGSSNGRADANAVAVFTFDEGAGTTTTDKAGQITLQITGMDWVQGGLKNVSGKAQANATDSRKLFDAINPAGQFSVEAWIIPDNLTQTGPARIVSYSNGTATRNFMLGQNTTDYRGRVRTSVSNANGDPQLDGANPDVATALQHVVLTFDPAVGRKLYVNGQLSAQENAPATLGWTNDQTFVIGNETSNDRLWMGTFELVAIHKKALSAAEVQQNFAAGAGGLVTLSFDVSSIVGAQARVDLLAAPLDAKSYLFAKPTFVGPANTRVKNIRIAVNDAVPVAAQTFRRVDTTCSASGTELSPLGAVVPAALGPTDGQVPSRVRGARDEGRARGDGAAVLAARAGAGRAGARARRAELLADRRDDVGAHGCEHRRYRRADALCRRARLAADERELARVRREPAARDPAPRDHVLRRDRGERDHVQRLLRRLHDRSRQRKVRSPTPSSTSCSARTSRTSRTKRPRTPSS